MVRAATAAGARVSVTGPAGDLRVTLHAARTTPSELQGALRDLLRLRVSRRGTEGQESTALSLDPRLSAQADAWRLRQADATLRGFLRIADQLLTGHENDTVRGQQERFRQEHPEFPKAALAVLNASYLRQSLLLTPLTPAARGQLTSSGWLWFPLAWLLPDDQALLASFAHRGPGRAAVEESQWQSGVTGARVQYRLLYGDRWTDQMLLAQVGTPGAWSMAMLPSILVRAKDASSLYPQAADHADDADVWRRLPSRFDVAGKDWDTVLIELATAMQIKLAADSYSRPWLFNTDRQLPEIAGIPLRDALDRLCQQHGYFWWKQNGWYLLRSRNWVEESRVAVPDRLLRGWLDSARIKGGLTDADLLQMATLTDEQLLTLNLRSLPAGEVQFPGTGFDPDAAALMAQSLSLFRSLPPAQREMALGGGLPALWLPPPQQALFAGIAALAGTPLLPEEAETWSFRVNQEFSTVSSPGHPPSGSVIAEWRFGPAESLRATVFVGDPSIHQTVDSANPSDVR
jgi:hypothetical protein